MITLQRCLAVAVPLRSKQILTKGVTKVSAIVMFCFSLFVGLSRFLFDATHYFSLHELKIFYQHSLIYERVLFFATSLLPVYGVMLLSIILMISLNCCGMHSLNGRQTHKKVTKMTTILAITFSLLEMPTFVLQYVQQFHYYVLVSNILLSWIPTLIL